MAKSDMKRLTLVGMNADKMRVLRKLQRLGCVEVLRTTDAGSETERARLSEAESTLARLEAAMERLKPQDPVKRGWFGRRSAAGSDALAAAQAGAREIMARVTRLEEMEREQAALKETEARCENGIRRLAPWSALDVPLKNLRGEGRSVLLLAGARQNMAAFREQAAGIEPAPEIREMPVWEGRGHGALVVYMGALAETEALVNAHGLERVWLDEFEGLPAEEMEELRREKEECLRAQEKNDREMADMARDLESMRLLRDLMAIRRDRWAAAEKTVSTRTAFVLEGWVPGRAQKQVEDAIGRGFRDVCREIRDPREDEKPPVLRGNALQALGLANVEFLDRFQRQTGGFEPLRYETRYVDIDPMYEAD